MIEPLNLEKKYSRSPETAMEQLIRDYDSGYINVSELINALEIHHDKINELIAKVNELEAKQPTASELVVDTDDGIDHLDPRHTHWDNFDAPEATNE